MLFFRRGVSFDLSLIGSLLGDKWGRKLIFTNWIFQKSLSKFQQASFLFWNKFVILAHFGTKSPTLGTFSLFLGLSQQLVESTVNAERASFSRSPTFLIFLLRIKWEWLYNGVWNKSGWKWKLAKIRIIHFLAGSFKTS